MYDGLMIFLSIVERASLGRRVSQWFRPQFRIACSNDQQNIYIGEETGL